MKNIKNYKMELKGLVLECMVEGRFDSAIQFLHKYIDFVLENDEIDFKDRFFYYYNMISCYRALDKVANMLDYLAILQFVINTGYITIKEYYNPQLIMFNELKESIEEEYEIVM